ncbi:MAG: alpha-L-fucosidase [Oscillospiraceae bacterium]|nr:alpha-L-fucosidase [Oscillospiraceae bacterium]MCL2280222.1 alpha-L-fucosidase [Oscillospiraceae bacterium]
MDRTEYKKRISWYQHDRFGMFIHWGLYAIPARGEWVRSVEKMSVEDYQKYFDAFDPTDYDPKEWARLAKHAGMKYAVLTAKHHDGFCLFDSKLTEYKSTNTKAGRDLVREYVDAFRAEGIKVGLYFSIIDWYHKDYPHYGDRQHPMRDNEDYKDHAKEENFDNYLDFMHGQVREICTNYGKLDILWFDFSYGDMSGEKWRATELVRMVRSLQPDVLIDNRLEASGEGFGSLLSGNPSEYSGDFVSPEQIIPPEGILDVNGEPVAWEACVTLNNTWGYHAHDHNWKNAKTIVRKLVECVSKGGNLLLNVGPDAKGRIPKESVEILTKVGDWMKQNSASIYGCGASKIPQQPWGAITENDKEIFLHIYEETVGAVPLKGLSRDDIKLVQFEATGAEIQLTTSWTTGNYPDYLYVPVGPDAFGTYALPDEIDTVIRVTKV